MVSPKYGPPTRSRQTSAPPVFWAKVGGSATSSGTSGAARSSFDWVREVPMLVTPSARAS